MIAAGVSTGNLGAMPYAVEQCDNCNMSYSRLVPWQRFCCKTCRQEYNYDKNREKRIDYQRQYRAGNKSVKRIKSSLTHLTKLEEKIDRLEALLQRAIEAGFNVSAPQSPAPTTREAPAPKALDELPELEIKRSEGDGKKATANFMRSLIAIQTSAKPHAPMAVPQVREVVQSGNAKAMDVPQFSAPSFDDDDLLGDIQL